MDSPSSEGTLAEIDDLLTVRSQPRRLQTWLLRCQVFWHKVSNKTKGYAQTAQKGGMVTWVVLACTGLTLMISVFYALIFILQPNAQYRTSLHNSISHEPVGADDQIEQGLKRWEDDFARTVIPIMCHSHNDYWRTYPLFSALAAGCTGVEADVWLTEDGTDLLVGHDPSELRPERTLKKMYLDPLMEILDRRNPDKDWSNHTVYDRARGVFPSHPNTTLALLIDVKGDPQKIWELVEAQLEPLRAKQYLTRYEMVYPAPGFVERQSMWPGPVHVVASGNMDSEAFYAYVRSLPMVKAEGQSTSQHNVYHDYFLDAPLDILPQKNTFLQGTDGNGNRWTGANLIYYPETAYYASTSFNKAIGSVRMGFSQKQLDTLREQIDIAKKSKLKARYYDLPSWPINYRDYVWDVLTREGVGMLSVDDLESASNRGWSKGYIRSVIWMIVVSVWLVLTSVAMLWIVYKLLRKRNELAARQQDVIYLE